MFSRAFSTARLSASALFASVFLAALSCASPTLPLPPPAVPSIIDIEGGSVTLRSVNGVEPNALVIITNDRDGLSNADRAEAVFADENGSWEEKIAASPGDVVQIVQQFGTALSPPTTLQIPAVSR